MSECSCNFREQLDTVTCLSPGGRDAAGKPLPIAVCVQEFIPSITVPLGETVIRQRLYFTACEHSLTAQPLGAFQTATVSGPNLKFSFRGGLLLQLIPQVPHQGPELDGGAGAWGWTGQGWLMAG